ncbi:Hypothetical protein DB32_007641 [Sandaracinus amylolyticus]|uniref:Teneurin-like YD-shell domain-containing protein n=1 Tax=Sandaracinus amylolyticus TaxID=927083 RepID=A0A0F6W917_9BACT|nr:Hypothetical protein DB32_007641 [Sandaracinus amylolyticus]
MFAGGGALAHEIRYGYEPVPTMGANRGFLSSETHDQPGLPEMVVTSSYDSFGRPLQLGYPGEAGAFAVTHEYDSFGHLNRLRDSTGTLLWESLESYQGYRRAGETFGNGVESSVSFEPLTGRIQRMSTTSAAGVARDVTYAYDLDGRRASEIDGLTPANSRAFVHDVLGRLTDVTNLDGTVTHESTRYDALGNITFRTGIGTYDSNDPSGSPHAVSQAGGNSYSYDARGRQQERSGPQVSGGFQRIDEYTAFDLPTTIVVGAGEAAETVEMRYDASDRIAARLSTGTDIRYIGRLYSREETSAGVEHRFRVYADGHQVVEVTRHTGGVGGTTESRQFLHADALGSIVLVTDDNGHEVDERSYASFGDAGSVTGPEAGYTGHRHDDELGLIDMIGRVYDPVIGRFLTPDPITAMPTWTQSLNRYAYVYNSPFVDRSDWLQRGERHEHGWWACHASAAPRCRVARIRRTGEPDIRRPSVAGPIGRHVAAAESLRRRDQLERRADRDRRCRGRTIAFHRLGNASRPDCPSRRGYRGRSHGVCRPAPDRPRECTCFRDWRAHRLDWWPGIRRCRDRERARRHRGIGGRWHRRGCSERGSQSRTRGCWGRRGCGARDRWSGRCGRARARRRDRARSHRPHERRRRRFREPARVLRARRRSPVRTGESGRAATDSWSEREECSPHRGHRPGAESRRARRTPTSRV